MAWAYLALFFERVERPEVAAILYGATTLQLHMAIVDEVPAAADRLDAVLGNTTSSPTDVDGPTNHSVGAGLMTRHTPEPRTAVRPSASVISPRQNII